jgi:hypothetical protein
MKNIDKEELEESFISNTGNTNVCLYAYYEKNELY